MRPYQEEYIANLKQANAFTRWRRLKGQSFEEYAAQVRENEALTLKRAKHNMELLRGCLFPVLDNLFEAGEDELRELEEFAAKLFNVQEELDGGLFCQIHQALLALARQKGDRAGTIRELYWLGMGRHSLCSKLVGLEPDDVEEYTIRMRLCFTEAAAYRKYYDEIEDAETRGYILRSQANIALGQFHSPGEKIRLLKKTLQILQDKGYQEKEPSLPWERFIYLTHQNMASSISHSREKVMSPEDMADIMESAYIVYHGRFEEAERLHKQPPAKSAFAYYAIEYYCGLCDLDTFLTRMEGLLDAADPGDYSVDGMYGMISLPAFYCQYLQQYPERLPGRAEYVEGLYQRILDYAAAFPGERGNPSLFQYLRQLSHTFLETRHSVPYGAFLQRFLLRFAPDIYIHSQIVGTAAQALCEIILEDDPGFFDDIEFLRSIPDPEEKRRETLAYAMGCGAFHDVGKINFIELYARSSRQWFEVEYGMARLHAAAGGAMLAARRSTRRYAAAALGHHAWYDGSRGYPEAYRRLECPERQMVDVIALVDWLEDVTRSARVRTGEEKTFSEAAAAAAALEGRRFSPLLTAHLREPETVRRLQAAFAAGGRAAYLRLYEDAPGAQ